jgi:hypothetical protein
MLGTRQLDQLLRLTIEAGGQLTRSSPPPVRDRGVPLAALDSFPP